jgi:transcription termination/antitermination protein NusG
MLYYAIQVRTTEEDEFVKRVGTSPLLSDERFFVPKRVVDIRKNGKVKKNQVLTIFPGYVFLETEELTIDQFWVLRRTDGFYRFLRDNQDRTPLVDSDKELLLHFISLGERADKSKVIFDENDRIVVLDGALKGLEGSIVKVDRRRGRAKVRLDFCQAGFLVDLGFEVVERVRQGGPSSNGES